MDTDDRRATPSCLDREPNGSGITVRGLGNSCQLANKTLARATDQHRVTCLGEPTGARDQLQLLGHALAEAQPRIERDALVLNTSRLAYVRPLDQKFTDVLDDVVVGRPGKGVLRQATAMHQD